MQPPLAVTPRHLNLRLTLARVVVKHSAPPQGPSVEPPSSSHAPHHPATMAPSGKATEGRRKAGGKPSLVVTLAVSPARLREILPGFIKEDTPSVKDVPVPKDVKDSPANSSAPVNSNGENASDSNTATPAAEGTPAPSVMGPPTEGPKKKGTKRSAVGANGATDGSAKPRGKPGPKKKPRLYVLPLPLTMSRATCSRRVVQVGGCLISVYCILTHMAGRTAP